MILSYIAAECPVGYYGDACLGKCPKCDPHHSTGECDHKTGQCHCKNGFLSYTLCRQGMGCTEMVCICVL